jgi:DNA polymerase-1
LVDAIAERRRAAAIHVHASALLAHVSDDGRVRATWDPVGCSTGRMSTCDPNLLGLPRALRHCIRAPEGSALVVADYSAIELRVLAEVTGDTRLIEIFSSGGDPHRAMAALLSGKSPDTVTKEERQGAKAVNFGLTFGMGSETLIAYALKNYGVRLSLADANRFRDGYRAALPGVAAWQTKTRDEMPLEVATLGGRVRRFADRSDGYTERLAHPIQGTAAEGLKRALVLLAPRLPAQGARIVLAVHDEIVVECPIDRAPDVESLLVTAMREGMGAYVERVPVEVVSAVRPTWGEGGVR